MRPGTRSVDSTRGAAYALFEHRIRADAESHLHIPRRRAHAESIVEPLRDLIAVPRAAAQRGRGLPAPGRHELLGVALEVVEAERARWIGVAAHRERAHRQLAAA